MKRLLFCYKTKKREREKEWKMKALWSLHKPNFEEERFGKRNLLLMKNFQEKKKIILVVFGWCTLKLQILQGIIQVCLLKTLKLVSSGCFSKSVFIYQKYGSGTFCTFVFSLKMWRISMEITLNE